MSEEEEMPIIGLKMCYGDLEILIRPLFLFSKVPFHDTRNYKDGALTLGEVYQLLWAARISHIQVDTEPHHTPE